MITPKVLNPVTMCSITAWSSTLTTHTHATRQEDQGQKSTISQLIIVFVVTGSNNGFPWYVRRPWGSLSIQVAARFFVKARLCTFFSLLFFLLFFFHPIYTIFALLFSLPPSRNSDPGSHSRLFSPPTYYGSGLEFLSREDLSSFFPRRLTSDCAYPC